jgi:hypothetical protein
MRVIICQRGKMKRIKVTCRGADVLPIDSLLEFQGKLKKITKVNLDKLKKRIIKDGINVPLFIWREHDLCHILDGHQRLKALLSLRQDGYELPLIPVAYIEAENENDARQKLLGITSQYGDFVIEELGEWLKELDKDILDTIKIDIQDCNLEFEKKSKTIGKKYYNGLHDLDDVYKEKIIYRLIGLFKIKKRKCVVELFAGSGILTKIYNDIFKQVITNDKNVKECKYNLAAIDFIKTEINKYEIDCIDFDDEGMPQKELQEFFKIYNFKKPLLLFITDGGIINAKIKGKINFKEYYLVNKCKYKSYYQSYEQMNIDLIDKLCKTKDLKYNLLFSVKKNNTNCIYQGFKIIPN